MAWTRMSLTKIVMIFFTKNRAYFFTLLLFFSQFYANGQSCDCPPVNSCGPCQSGFTNFTFRYNGGLAATIAASDGGGLIYLDLLVASGETFTIEGSLSNGKFEGNELELWVNGFLNYSIDTNCGSAVAVNATLGSFTVLAAESFTGGPLCCSPADVDTSLPVITNCPTDIQVSLTPPSCSVIVNWVPPTATDNCGGAAMTSTHGSGTSFSAGTTPVVYTATDNYGNTATCSFNVTVIGNTNPVITGCPSNITVNANATCKASVPWTAPSVAGNCGPVSLSSTHTPGSLFPIGTTVVQYTATGETGNISTCSFTVTVVDKTKPVISGCSPSAINAVADASCRASVSWAVPTVTDNCGSGNVTLTSTHNPGSTFPIGTTTVTYTATDAAGNFSKCTFNVIVSDQTGPVFSGYADITVQAPQNFCGANVSWTPPIVTDCGALTLSSSHDPGDSFPVGTTEVTYTAVDNKNNSTTCKFKVVVEDKLAPVFQNCSEDIIINSSESCSAVINWTIPTVSDNCGTVQVTSSHAPGETFLPGTTEVKYTATDAQGNISVCSFDVILKNETIPVITNCPEDIHVTGNELGEAKVDWFAPDATAVCGEVTLTSSHQPGSIFEIGTSVVEYAAKDISGNTSYCKFNIVVTQQEINLEIGKVVTPDGNGINDEWVIKNIEKFNKNKIVIVDRWGSVIFSATGYNNENVVWRGSNRNGSLVPTGTYFYTISVQYGPEVFEKNGFIELIR